MGRQLRPYQADAVTDVEKQHANGITRTAGLAATGLGKTDIGSAIATDDAAEGKRVLWLAHRGDLLNQATARMRLYDPKVPIGRIENTRNDVGRRIVVASVPTLSRDERIASLLATFKDHGPIDRIIYDECHHAAAPSGMRILSAMGAFDHVPTLGLTATMTRGDKRSLGDVWESIAFTYDIAWGVEQGHLVRPHGRVVVGDHMDLEHAKTSKGDYVEAELGEMVTQDVDQIVKAWQEHAQLPDGSSRITAAYVPTVESAWALLAAFRAVGVPADIVLGSTKQRERTQVYKELAAGRIRVLVSVMVTTEGWDCPPVSCILMARPTKLPGLYTQIIGRGLRLSPETGKTDCLVLDVVGASRLQRLVTLVDLLPGAELDRTELDALPCGECGGAPRGTSLSEEAPFQCTCGAGERDPDGGRRRLIGPAVYEDVDLFGKSSCNWLFTRRGIRFLPTAERLVFLWPDTNSADGEASTYSVGVINSRNRTDGQWLDGEVPHTLDEARLLGERWAVDVDSSLSTKTASWRSAQKASDKQVAFAHQLRIPNPEQYTKARLSDEISIVMASRVLDRL